MGLFGSNAGSIIAGGLASALGRKIAGKTGGEIAGGLGKLAGGLAGSFLPFAKGGRVKGKKGKAVPIMAHAGEVVLPVGVKPTKAQVSAIKKRGGKM